MCRSKEAGRDIVHYENKTHVELNTRHVVAKTGGWRLFDIHEEGSGGGPPGPVAQGMTGIGIVGEVLLLIMMLMFALWVFRKCAECRAKHSAYKGFYRKQVADSALALPTISTGRDYGPNLRATTELLREVRAARQELRAAKRSTDRPKTTTTTASVHVPPRDNNGARTIYDDTDDEAA